MIFGLIAIMFCAVVFSLLAYFVKKLDVDSNSATFLDSMFATGKYRNNVPGIFWVFLWITAIIISIVYWR